MYLGTQKERYLKAYIEDLHSFKSFGYSIKIWHDEEIRELIKREYTEDLLFSYDSIIPYGYKSDIARLAILNYYGGWYADLGVKLVTDLPDVNGIDFLGFMDYPAKEKWNGLQAMQTAFIYATPKNKYIDIILDRIIDRCKNKDYGKNHHDVTGPVLWGTVFDEIKNDANIKFSTGDFGLIIKNNRLAYSIDHQVFALFKDQNVNNNLKTIGKYDTDYALAWSDKMVYA